MAEDNRWEKMSKSKGNVICPEEVVWGVLRMIPGYEFRNSLNEVVDFKEFGIWRDCSDTNCYFTSTRTGKQPVWLCEIGGEPCMFNVPFCPHGGRTGEFEQHK